MESFTKKRKQSDYKPGSVRAKHVSAIYLLHESPHESSVLPSTA